MNDIVFLLAILQRGPSFVESNYDHVAVAVFD